MAIETVIPLGDTEDQSVLPASTRKALAAAGTDLRVTQIYVKEDSIELRLVRGWMFITVIHERDGAGRMRRSEVNLRDRRIPWGIGDYRNVRRSTVTPYAHLPKLRHRRTVGGVRMTTSSFEWLVSAPLSEIETWWQGYRGKRQASSDKEYRQVHENEIAHKREAIARMQQELADLIAGLSEWDQPVPMLTDEELA